MAVSADTRSQWARLGARARLQEIDQERAAILKAFPELKRGTHAGIGAGGPRRKISAAARRAMSAGMRKYWARRKAQAAKAQTK